MAFHLPSLRGRHPGSPSGPGFGNAGNPFAYLGGIAPAAPVVAPAAPVASVRSPRPPRSAASPRPAGFPQVPAFGKGGHAGDYRHGGTAPGKGEQDTVPALLTPGEFVVRKGPAQQHKELLKHINNEPKGYAKGGMATIGPEKKGQKPITFKKGALHRQLGVPEGEPIPAEKKREALSGTLGPLAKKRANFGFRGALKKGRETAAK